MKKVAVGFIVKDKKVLLIKHKRKNMWLPVGGHVELGESFEEALKREIKEEVNIKIEIKSVFSILEEDNELTYQYLCLFKGGEIKINKKEILEYKWFSESEIKHSSINKDVRKFSLMALNLNSHQIFSNLCILENFPCFC